MPEEGLQAQAVIQQPKSGSVYTALAGTATRTLALYFSRPVRLFRPSKLSGWQQLRAQAQQNGQSLSPQYMLWVVRNQFNVLPKHFLPPIAVNASLGTVLWVTYSEVSSRLDPVLGHHPTVVASMAGGAAGAMQALAAAPVENVRIIVEGGSAQAGWSNAWKEVFRRHRDSSISSDGPLPSGRSALPGSAYNESKMTFGEVKKVREVRSWVRDVRGLAGRGWEGWGWGVAKDSCGFAVFFAVFELTRRIAGHTKAISETVTNYVSSRNENAEALRRHAPRTIHGVTLVTGGVVAGLGYEMITRPWDAARRAVHLEEVSPGASSRYTRYTVPRAVARLYREQGLIGFFRDPSAALAAGATAALPPGDRLKMRAWTMVRVLGRVGPWGVGFLVWEMVS